MSTVLVTGAARGIGRAIVDHLATAGWNVIAGVRTAQDAAAITENRPRVTAVILDVTDAGHRAALRNALPARLDAVVNNAGIVVAGPVETVTPEEWRNQFDVNVIGQFAVTRAVLPRLRESGGRIVFISSVNGRISMPLLGAYCASKFALEAAADALRMEVKGWGIAVVVVEPAQTDTDMWRTADDMVLQTEAAMTPEQRALYARHIAGMKKFIPLSRKLAVPAAKVGQVVDQALTARRPRTRYVVGLGPKIQTTVIANLPAPLRDQMMAAIVGLPRRPGG